MKSWKGHLEQALRRLSPADHPLHLAIIGVGHPLCGDDALGLHAAQHLQKRLPPWPGLLVLACGPAPENFCGQLRRFRPDLLLLLDAAHLDRPPGTIEWISRRLARGCSACTHSLGLELMLTYLVRETGCEAALLGIQPADCSFGAGLSEPVQQALTVLVREVAAACSLYLPGRQPVGSEYDAPPVQERL